MKIPCEDCITLPICKTESYEYDPWQTFINNKTFRMCIQKELEQFCRLSGREYDEEKYIFLMVIRRFLRPDLDYLPYFISRSLVRQNVILEKSKRILNEHSM